MPNCEIVLPITNPRNYLKVIVNIQNALQASGQVWIDKIYGEARVRETRIDGKLEKMLVTIAQEGEVDLITFDDSLISSCFFVLKDPKTVSFGYKDTDIAFEMSILFFIDLQKIDTTMKFYYENIIFEQLMRILESTNRNESAYFEVKKFYNTNVKSVLSDFYSTNMIEKMNIVYPKACFRIDLACASALDCDDTFVFDNTLC